MTDRGPLDLLPIWGVFLDAVVALLLAFEGGVLKGSDAHSAPEDVV
jgi:hypothetical protein